MAYVRIGGAIDLIRDFALRLCLIVGSFSCWRRPTGQSVSRVSISFLSQPPSASFLTPAREADSKRGAFGLGPRYLSGHLMAR